MWIPLHATEKKIIQAYLRICYRKGFEKITLEKLAKESKISLASVRYHFSDANKTLEDTTLMYVLSRGYDFIRDFIEPEKKKTGYRALHTYVNANFAWLIAAPEESSFLIYYFYLLSSLNRERIAQLPYLEKARERMTEMYYADCARELLKPIADVRAFIVDLHTQLAGAMIVSLMENNKTARNNHRLRVLRSIPYSGRPK